MTEQPKFELKTDDISTTSASIREPEQHSKAPYKTNIGTKDKPDYRAVQQPNQNLMIIKTIQSLMTGVNDNLEKLPKSWLKSQALEDIDLFEKTTLNKLQKEFE